MSIPEHQERIKELELDVKDVDRMTSRIAFFFPGIEFEVKIENSKLSIIGLTKDQIAKVMTP